MRAAQVTFWALLSLRGGLGDLAVVRTYASSKEVDGLENAFQQWERLMPCQDLRVSVDLILVYSQSFANAKALNATLAIMDSYQANVSWARCFRSMYYVSANLTEQEDIYDARGYAVRRDWVNGPNSVFRFILGGFFNGSFPGDYDAFYFMEMDAIPIRAGWLDQFVLEALDYPRAAIRGSAYRGDSWDSFTDQLPEELLKHINGNAIYNLKHPWLEWLFGQLHEERDSENNSVAFDLRMADLTLQGEAGRAPVAAYYADLVPAGEQPYRADSSLIGNFANTLINSSFESGVFIRHGSADNIFENLAESQVTLAVASSVADFANTERSFASSHPFRKVLVAAYGVANESLPSDEVRNYSSVRGNTEATFFHGVQPLHMALCELASRVTTEFFVFSDSFHLISSPLYILVDQAGLPALPYIHTSSSHCTRHEECLQSIQQAESLFGVSLNYHHDVFETLFPTSLTNQFCSAWDLATSGLPSYEDCGVVFGPTANDFFAWQISVGEPLLYVPKDKEKLGSRAFSALHRPPPVDPRPCAVYTQEKVDQLLSNISGCSLILESRELCEAEPNCTYRSIFESGRCMSTPRMTPSWAIAIHTTSTTTTSTRSSTSTWSSSSTTDSSTSSISSTSSSSLSSSSTTVTSSTTVSSTSTSTMSSSTTFTTSSLTVTSTWSTTSSSRTQSMTSISVTKTTATATSTTISQTTTSLTFTAVPGTCPVPALALTADITDCFGKIPGETCTVSCIAGYVGETSVYTCGVGETFSGTPPSCLPTTTSTTATTTQTVLVLCTAGMPTGLGVDATGCDQLYNGQSCTATCTAPLEGGPAEYICDPSTASLVGPELICKPKECQVTQLPANLSVQDCAGKTAGEVCTVSCPAGYTGQEELYECLDTGIFVGQDVQCAALPCATSGLPVLLGVNISQCLGLFAGSECMLDCDFGFEGLAANFSCDLTGSFSGVAPSCQPKRCPMPAALLGHESFTSCDGLTHGQVCLSVCNPGYAGLLSQHLCRDGQLLGSAPNCVPQPCSFEGFPLTMGLNSSACLGAVSGESCQLSCWEGYELRGEATVTCQAASSTFSSSNASCEPAQCGNLSSAAFTSAAVEHSCQDVLFGEGCFASCSLGYQLEGNASMLYCMAASNTVHFMEFLEGQMQSAANSTGPSCTPKPCTAGVPNLQGTSHDCLGKATAETCDLSPELGFSLTGTTTLTCQADGSFTQDLPVVEPAACADVAFGTGVGSTCRNKTMGMDCWAYCLRGFEGGPKQYRCQANATANAVQIEQLADAIACIQSNETNATDANATSGRRLQTDSCLQGSVQTAGLGDLSYTHDCDPKVHDDACVAHCSLGWNMTESEPSIFLCDDGFLVGAALPTCIPLPCTFSFPNALGVLHTCDGARTAETCVASCTMAGYQYAAGSSAETFTCLASGSFTGQSPTCERIACSDLQLDSSYAHNCQGRRFQDSCEVGCAPGYTLSGSSSRRECQADANFSGGLPTCIGNPCVALATNPSVNTSGCDGLTTGQSCEVACLAGFEAANSSLTCDPSGFFLGSLPSCQPSLCPSLSLPSSLQSTCAGSTYGSTCAVYCAPGYGSTGSAVEEWRCIMDGELQLQGTQPVCEAQACTSGLPVDGTEVDSNCSVLKTGDSCVQRCAFGYSSASTGTWTCHEDGSASGSGASCSPVACVTSAVSPVSHGCDGIGFGGSCFAFCEAGYEAMGSAGERWHCAGNASGEVVMGVEVEGVAMRGVMPNCSAQLCIFNLPLGNQYMHNCSGARTGETCLVDCAEGFAGAREALECQPSRSFSGSLPSCLPVTRTSTTSSMTFTQTTTVTTIPFLCTAELYPTIPGAGNFSCQGPAGPGQKCTAPCDQGLEAVIVCWSNQAWQVNEACVAQESSKLVVFLLVTLGALCLLLVLIGAAVSHCSKTKTAVMQYKDAGAESEEDHVEAKTYDWAARRWETAQQLKDTRLHDAVDFMNFKEAQPDTSWRPPALPVPASPQGHQQALSLIALDDMFAGADPPTLQSLRRPPLPERVLQVDDDPSFRVWVQQVPATDDQAYAVYPGMVEADA